MKPVQVVIGRGSYLNVRTWRVTVVCPGKWFRAEWGWYPKPSDIAMTMEWAKARWGVVQ